MASFDAFHIHCLQYRWWTVSCWDLKFPSFKWCCLCGWSRGACRWTKTLWFQEGKDPFINPSCWLLLWGAKMWRSIAKMPRIWSLPLGCWCIWRVSPSHEVPPPPKTNQAVGPSFFAAQCFWMLLFHTPSWNQQLVCKFSEFNYIPVHWP